MATEQATRPPAFVDGKTQNANDMRLNILSGSGGATPLQSRAGVRPSGGNPGLVAALPTPVMKVRVNAGIADVPSTSTTGGFYRVSWDQVDLDIDPSSAQARTDLIIVEVVDTGTSAATGKVRVLKGTSGNGRPTNPVVNAHWFALAATAVRVNAEGTGNIRPQDVTPELQYAVAPGAPIQVRSQAERAALTPYPGLQVIRLDQANRIETYPLSGSTWHYGPLGEIARVERSAPVTDGNIGPTSVPLVMSTAYPSITLPSSRKIRFEFEGIFARSAGGGGHASNPGTLLVQIRQNGTTIIHTVLIPLGAVGLWTTVPGGKSVTLAAGTYTFDLMVGTLSPANDVRADAPLNSADRLLQFTITDKGPA